jgi:type IV pilus assembly protein PilW
MKYSVKKTAGFTLVEVMITVLLSLVMTFAISKVLITSNQSASTSDGLSQAQETGRFVMSYLASQVREAGLDNIDLIDPLPETVPFIDCNSYSALNNNSITGSNGISCSNQTTAGFTGSVGATFNGGDNLAVAWVPDIEPASDIRDCSGAGGYSEDDIVLNVFWVQPPTLSSPATATTSAVVGTPGSLWCQGHAFDGSSITRSNGAASIANGIDAMHVLYGEASAALPASSSNRNITKYVNASNVLNWSRVYAVRIAILSSAITGSGDADSSVYQLLDSDTYTINDNISRQVFSTTFVIENYK